MCSSDLGTSDRGLNTNRSGRSRALRSDLTSEETEKSNRVTRVLREALSRAPTEPQMARFFRQDGACTGGRKGAGLSVLQRSFASRVANRSVGRVVGAIPRSVHEPTKRPKHPGCSAAAPLRGDVEEQAALVVACAVGTGSSPFPPGRRRQGVLEHSYRGGERGTLRRHGASRQRPRPPAHALHSAVLGPCCQDPQGIWLLPSTEAGVIARTVLAA